MPAADASEAVTSAREPATPKVNGNVVPMVEACQDGGVRLGVRGLEISQGLIGKDHTPAESVVGPVPLVYFHTYRRQRLAQQNGRVQPRRAAAQAHYSSHPSSSPRRSPIASAIF